MSIQLERALLVPLVAFTVFMGCRTRLEDRADGDAAPVATEPRWSSPRHDAQNRARSPFRGPTDLIVKSQTNLSPGAVWFAVGADGTIFIGGGPAVMALDPVSGERRWTAQIGIPIVSTMVLAPSGELLLTTGINGAPTSLLALDPTDGEVTWRRSRRDGCYSPITPGPDGFYESCLERGVIKHRKVDGEVLWNAPIERPMVVALGADGAVLVASDESNRLTSLDPGTGAPRWSVSVTTSVGQVSVGDDGTIYYSDDVFRGPLVAADPATGQPRWTRAGRGLAPAFAPDGTLRISDGDQLIALSASGQELWRTPVPARRRFALPIVDGDGATYVLSGGSRPEPASLLHRITPEGRLVESLPASGTLGLAGTGMLLALGYQVDDVRFQIIDGH